MFQVEESIITVLLLSIISSVVVTYIVKYLWGRRWLYYYASKLDGPLALPFIGCIYLFRGGQEEFLDTVLDICEKYKSKPTKLWLGNSLHVVLHDLKDVERVLNNFMEKSPIYDLGKPILGDGLLTSPVNIWRPHRKVISLTFNQAVLNSFVDVFQKHANLLAKKFENYCGGDYFDVFPVVFETTLNLICETTMGTQVKEMDETSQYMVWLSEAQSMITNRFFKWWLHPEFIWRLTPLHNQFQDVCSKMWRYVGEIVETKKIKKSAKPTSLAERRSSTDFLPKKKIFLDLLIDLTDNEDKWTNEELMVEGQTMIVGGSETSAIMQSFALIMLAMHQEIQEKVFKEITEIFGNADRPIKPEDLNRMTYLERVLKETIRLFPVTTFIARTIDRDVTLESCTLPRGSVAIIPNYMIQTDPNHWKEPLKFDPDRFLPEEVAKRHKYAYLGFSLGPRDCIGKRYGMMSMKSILSTILRKFRVVSTTYRSVEDVKLMINAMTKAKYGYKIKVEPRKKI